MHIDSNTMFQASWRDNIKFAMYVEMNSTVRSSVCVLMSVCQHVFMFCLCSYLPVYLHVSY